MGSLGLIIAIVPFAMKRNPRLNLPGAPWLRERLARFRPVRTLRTRIKPALKFGLILAIVVLALAFLGLHFQVIRNPPPIRIPLHPTLVEMIASLAVAMLIPIGAAVSEEIVFRVGILALLASWFRLRWPDRFGRPTELAMWLAIALQAYLFGIVHEVAGGIASKMFGGSPLISAFLLPQTWAGFLLGIIYRRQGLEAAILAHFFMDLIEVNLGGFVMGIQIGLARPGHH
jgi:membrane protease YdiL (CAAX protease family)